MSSRTSKRSPDKRARKLSQECYYKILNVSKTADETAIKRAYRKLALKWHPDKNKSSPETASEMFKQVAEAFEVLSDPEKREVYDKYGRQGVKNGVQSNDVDFNGFHFDFSDAAAMFDQFFGSDPFFHDPHFGFGSMAQPHQQQMGRRPFGHGFFSDPFDNMMEDPFFSSGFGGAGNFSSSFQSFSSQGATGGISRSTRTVTKVINGERVTKTETTVRYPDGRVETTSNETAGSLEDERTRKSRAHRSKLGWF